MEFFLNLVAGNFEILFVLFGFAYFLISQKDTPASVEKKYYWLMFACSIILLVFVPLELWAKQDISRYNLRVFSSVIAYWVRPAAVMFLVFSCTPKSKKRLLILIPEIINIICIGTAFFGDHAFYYDRTTYEFIRLPLGYAPHIVALFYAILLVVILIREVTKGFKIESGILFICVFFSTIGLLYTMFTGYEFVSFSIAASGFFHYLFIRAARHYEEITNQIKNLEEAKIEADRANATKTKFLLNMSHDIRTPMNAIIGFSEIMNKNPNDPEKIKDYTKKLMVSGGYLLSLINEMLEMSKIESGELFLYEKPSRITEIAESIGSIFTPQAVEKNISLTSVIDITHDNIMCDDTKVFEIFFNLISNSIKYTYDGGKITITVKETTSKSSSDVRYKIVVSDTGMGISEEFLPHIFEEFSREKSTTEGKIAGTGLGMPIVKRLVDLMNGDISIDSKPNVGTTIIVELPLKLASENEELPMSSPSQPTNPVPTDRKVNILLVEDNDLNAEVAITLLEDEGYSVTRASDGTYCLDMLEEASKNEVIPYNIILMDIQMPLLDGHETTRRIRKMDNKLVANLPIIAMTANAFEEDRQKATEAGTNDHIAKPIDIDALKKLINSYTR